MRRGRLGRGSGKRSGLDVSNKRAKVTQGPGSAMRPGAFRFQRAGARSDGGPNQCHT